jgi:molybdopterin/thiamine biosynthesis adenylyltransferase
LGGLGSTIAYLLRDSTLVSEMHLIDMDLVEAVNLSTQFLYGVSAIGKKKTDAAKETLQSLGAPFPIHSHPGSFEEMDLSFVGTADIVVCSFDTYSARALFHYEVCGLARHGETLYIDCGADMYMGHVFFNLIGESPCLYCLRGLFVERPQRRGICSYRNVESVIDDADESTKDRVAISMLEEFRRSDPRNVHRRVCEFFNSRVVPRNPALSPIDETYLVYLDDTVIPNLSYVISVVGGLVLLQVTQFFGGVQVETNFIFYNGEKSPHFYRTRLHGEEECIVCRESSPERGRGKCSSR